MLGQALRIVKQAQPPGPAGVNYSLEQVATKIKEGGVHPKVRAWTLEQLTRGRQELGLQVDNDRDRAAILLRAVQKKLWVPDPVGSEFIAGAHLMACDRSTKTELCFLSGDCFAQGTLMLREGHEFVAVEELRVGEKIWGLDRWSTVQAKLYKGTLPVDVVHLNNGSSLKLTSEHRVYVLDCREHPMLDDSDNPKALPEDKFWRKQDEEHPKNGNGCSCHLERRTEKHTRVSELRRGMVLPTPERIPFGDVDFDPDRAYVEGLYVSDGWSDRNTRFSISGQDDCPKAAQKREVQAICERLGIHTRWNRKYIAVNDGEWALRMQQMGHYAPEKHLLSVSLTEKCAAESLRGVMADSGKNVSGGRTFTTTSFELALQTRLLHKMFGIACGWSYIENHGGLGKNPIYRLTVPPGIRKKLLRVKEVDRSVFEAPCWDIQTDDHRVYLPEHDVTVANCDDLVVLLGSCFLSAGLQTSVVGHSYDGAKNISHVLTAVRIGNKWEYADPTPTNFKLGEAVEFTRERVLSVPNVRVVCDEDVCFKDGSEFHPRDHDFVVEGTYIGVDGLPLRPKFYWIKPISALGQQEEKISVQSVVERCTAGRGTTKEDLKGAAGCAADIWCGTYGVPPGACGGVVEFVLDVIDEVFSAQPGPGFEGVVSRSIFLHNRLFPNEPRWWWEKVAPLQGIHLTFGPAGDGYYVPNAPVRRAYAAAKPPYDFSFFKNLDPAQPYSGVYAGADLSRLATASNQVQATLSARATKERASGQRASGENKTSKIVPVLAVGAAGAAAWYFWSDIVRFFR